MTLADTVQSVHLRASEGRRMRVVTDLVTIKATAKDTRDAYSLFEAETPPGGGSPPHIQRYDDETFYVLEGRYEFLLGHRQVELCAGDYAFVPRGTVHAFVNHGTVPARMLVFVTPGGIQEKFLEEVGDDAHRPAWEPDMAKVLAVAPKYGIELPDANAALGNTSAGPDVRGEAVMRGS